MTALITLAHGSRHPRAAAGVEALTRAAARRLGVRGQAAYLEFDEPLLIDATRHTPEPTIIVPLLFTDAFHARYDVPQHVAEAREAQARESAGSQASLTLAKGLGIDQDLVDVLAARVLQDAPVGAHVVLYPVGTSDPVAAGRYGEVADGVEKQTARAVSVVAATRGGVEELRALERTHGALHVLPMFVTHGLLLDRARAALPGASFSEPLGTDLAAIVAKRFSQALNDLEVTHA
ncbi:hypothetical protein HMPREF3104_04835 [Corynebacterium sp. HMSC30G07]|uniref:sirohydrochlorin chelatase n=1 Tax=Corynebacterium sp. HMSC30G07 TaxID=1581072 RepID=UPI0008A5E2EE|nr:CbiX/SirB N-terminal domain-containing protein [Corynebacterium sp. HMSC30G07]OFT76611.1 hypothetical protein HMPREF3104_04835 [Corynebacterium sp. HMSC30G07]